VLAQLALYTFGQPGSILFWAAALLYPPPLATLILTAGGTGGPSDFLRLEVLGPLFAIALLLGRLATLFRAAEEEVPWPAPSQALR